MNQPLCKGFVVVGEVSGEIHARSLHGLASMTNTHTCQLMVLIRKYRRNFETHAYGGRLQFVPVGSIDCNVLIATGSAQNLSNVTFELGIA
jgi:hypothetical protein